MEDQTHMIAITSIDENSVRRAHRVAVKTFGTLTSSITRSDPDDYWSFSIVHNGECPSGGCDGRAIERQTYKTWLRTTVTDGACLYWVEMERNTENRSPKVTDSSDTSNLTIDSAAVLAASFGLSIGQLVAGLCANGALSSTRLTNRRLGKEAFMPVLSRMVEQSSSVLGSACLEIDGRLALELPPREAFEVARLVATYYQRPIPLLDPVTRALSGVALPCPPPGGLALTCNETLRATSSSPCRMIQFGGIPPKSAERVDGFEGAAATCRDQETQRQPRG